MTSRIKNFDGIFNFRDFGDYPTQDGRRIQKDILYRSAHLNAISADDNNTLSEMDIGLVVDLRYAPERAKQPSLWQPQNVFNYPDPIDKPSAKVAPHEAFLEHELETPADARAYMMSSYARRPDMPGFRQIFGDTLRHMAATGEGVLVHCAAGKDRTGTLCAIIQGALGVSPDLIMEDYMLTMKAVDIPSILEPAAQMYSERYGKNFEPAAIEPMFSVEEDYLRSSINIIEDMDYYIREGLGVSDKEKAALKAAYLVS